MATLVIELELDLGVERSAYCNTTWPDLDIPDDVKKANGRMILDGANVATVSASLVRLRTLEVLDCPTALVDALLLDAPAPLPRLKILDIDAWIPRGGTSAGRKEFNVRLSACPEMHTLHLSAGYRGCTSLPYTDEGGAPCGSIRHVGINMFLAPFNSRSHDIGALFPNLLSFSATGLDDPNLTQPMFQTLPRHLQRLHIRQTDWDDPADIVSFLRRFPRLDEFYLAGASFDIVSVVRYLRATPKIQDVGFGRYCALSDATLEDLVSIPHLKTLELD